MLVRILAIIIVLLLAIPSFAQSEFGLRLSAGRIKLKGDQIETQDLAMRADFGLRLGAFYQFALKKDVRLQIGVSYMEYKGTLQTLDTLFQIAPLPGGPPGRIPVIIETEWRDSLNLTIQAIEFPFTLNVISNNDRWEFASGLVATFPINVTREDLNGTKEVDDEFSTLNTSIIFSTAYVIPLGRNSIKIAITYSQGLLNISKSNEVSTGELSRIKPTSLNLGLVWAYQTRKM